MPEQPTSPETSIDLPEPRKRESDYNLLVVLPSAGSGSAYISIEGLVASLEQSQTDAVIPTRGVIQRPYTCNSL